MSKEKNKESNSNKGLQVSNESLKNLPPTKQKPPVPKNVVPPKDAGKS